MKITWYDYDIFPGVLFTYDESSDVFMVVLNEVAKDDDKAWHLVNLATGRFVDGGDKSKSRFSKETLAAYLTVRGFGPFPVVKQHRGLAPIEQLETEEDEE